ncbi:hypothetical protein H4Q26_013769 [Puccinia striiformis f. sp. tritici PST-130]|nr:hypothetical protein H4Q26_013769 [Puccinia striiformis f. sp. tritici PST-130]
MSDHQLRLSTASELLSIDQEYEMCDCWALDDDIDWIKHKYKIAGEKGDTARAQLVELTKVPNEFSLDQSNYNREFFESQWQDQRRFQQNHTTIESEEQERLAVYLNRQATLETLRRQINQIANHQANPGTYNSIMESLIEISEAWEQQISVKVDFTSFPAALVESDSEEQNVRLLIWHAKSRLYAHAVALYAEQQPLYWGTHIGTTLSTRIIAAITNCQKPIMASINKFNNVDLFHSQALWAKNADVHSGIQAVLVIDQTNEEKDIVSKEFKCAMSWAVELHTSIRAKLEDVDHQMLIALKETADLDEGMGSERDLTIPSITSLDLGQCKEGDKLAPVKSTLEEELLIHESLMRSWAGDVLELWKTGPVVEDQQIEVSSQDIIHILNEGDENAGSDVDGEEIRTEDLLNLLNIASGDPATDD